MTFLDEFAALTEERHQEVLRLLDVGFWVWKPAEEEVYWSDYLFDLFEVDPETYEPSLEAFAGFVHPDDREEVLSAVQEAAESGESFDIEFRYVPADTDEARWLRSRGQPDMREDDTLRKMVGVVQDVTDLKRAEQKREETRRYLELLFDLTPLALLVSTPDGTVKEINRAFAEEFGYETDRLVGRSAEELGLWVDHKERTEVLEKLESEGQVRRYQTRGRTASGEVREIEVSVDALTTQEETRLIWAIRDVTERNRYERQLKKQALHDAVTGLPNRNLLLDRMRQALDIAERSGKPIATLFVDLDDFKAVNDQYGHGAGDELLTKVGRRLQAAVRDGDTVARIAGDEFVVLMEEAPEEVAVEVARRILDTFEEPYRIGDHEVPAGASLGIAVTEPPNEELTTEEDLLRASDSAMYRSRQEDRRYHVFSSDDRQRAHRLHRKKRLHEAIEEDELVLYFQPIVDLRTGETRGAEALVRWEHPEHGLVAPGEFIPFAEETGLIGRIDQYVLKKAVRQAGQWHARGADIGPIRVNVTPHRDLDEPFQDELLALLEEESLPGEVLEIEITERLALRDSSQFDRLRERGVRLAIDDFGTGYSSLFYLRKLDADTLKIDPFFTQEVDTGDRTGVIVRAVLDIAEEFGMEVIAEGVETEKQRDRLAEIGCPLAQGYLFARPMPSDQFANYIGEKARAKR